MLVQLVLAEAPRRVLQFWGALVARSAVELLGAAMPEAQQDQRRLKGQLLVLLLGLPTVLHLLGVRLPAMP